MTEISETEIKSMTKEQNYMRGYEDGKSDALDKIIAEIEQSRYGLVNDGLDLALKIIDKYRKDGD